jgi:very-short-patch-repair endonuclease
VLLVAIRNVVRVLARKRSVRVGAQRMGRKVSNTHDATRDSQLRDKGYRTLRFTNDEVLNSRTAVITKIVEAL